MTATTVRQRLKLANVAPRLFELYRTDEINLDQLMALAVTDDHAAQERVWDSAQEWQRNPNTLRRALTETMVDAASDPRARFVGIEAYIKAGGQIDRDLFQPEHEGYLTDPAKLDRLIAGKLETLAAEVRGEGWKWVEILPAAQYPDLTKFDRIRSVHAPVTRKSGPRLKPCKPNRSRSRKRIKRPRNTRQTLIRAWPKLKRESTS